MSQVAKPFVKDPETDADVNRVIASLGDLKPDGRLITHDQIEAALRTNRKTAHYQNVMHHVRRRLEHERSLLLDGRGNKGLGWRVLTSESMVIHNRRAVQNNVRLAKRGVRRMSMPLNEELPEQLRSFRAGFVTAMSRALAGVDQAVKDARALPGVVKALPR